MSFLIDLLARTLSPERIAELVGRFVPADKRPTCCCGHSFARHAEGGACALCLEYAAEHVRVDGYLAGWSLLRTCHLYHLRDATRTRLHLKVQGLPARAKKGRCHVWTCDQPAAFVFYVPGRRRTGRWYYFTKEVCAAHAARLAKRYRIGLPPAGFTPTFPELPWVRP